MAAPVMDRVSLEKFADLFFNKQAAASTTAPGAVFVVVKEGRILLQKGYGSADASNQTPVDPERTAFRLGSIAKTLTAAAVMQLVEEGKIDLRADADAYLEGIAIRRPEGVRLTVEHLLTHTAGFDYADIRPDDLQFDLSKHVTIREFVERHLPSVVRTPGEAYAYDNFAYILLGLIVENVSGLPFRSYMQERVFGPLEMTDSDYRLTPELFAQLAPGYDPSGTFAIPPYTMLPTDMPHGGFISTGSDMAKFLAALTAGDKTEGRSILSERAIAGMLSVHVVAHPAVPNAGYGFEALFHNRHNGQCVIGKGGDLPGYSSLLWVLPAHKAAAFVVYNRNGEWRESLFQAFMDYYYPVEPADLRMESLGAAPPDLQACAGTFRDLRYKSWLTKVRLQPEGGLFVEDNRLGRHRLQHVRDSLFKDEQGKPAAFVQGADGSVKYLYYANMVSFAERVENEAVFPDMPADDPFLPWVRDLQWMDPEAIQDGVRPGEPITKGEFAAKLVRLAGWRLTSSGGVTLPDGMPRELLAAAELGLLDGFANGAFEAEAPLTRQEAAVIAARFLALRGVPAMEAAVAGAVDDWALPAVKTLVALGLYGPEAQAGDDGAVDYEAQRPMLRCEAAVLLVKLQP